MALFKSVVAHVPGSPMGAGRGTIKLRNGKLRKDTISRFGKDTQVGPGQAMLDLACGRGGVGLWLARATGAQLTGVDFSPVGITAATARAPGWANACRPHRHALHRHASLTTPSQPAELLLPETPQKSARTGRLAAAFCQGCAAKTCATAPLLTAVVLIGSILIGAVNDRSPAPRTTG